MKRRQVYAIRSLFYCAEATIPRGDHSRVTEYERDRFADASVALWDRDLRRMWSHLRRLSSWGSAERLDQWGDLMDRVRGLLQCG